MPEPSEPARIPDLHKGAFWIWGVTAMIMREPLSVAIRQVSAEGIGSQTAQLVCLRTAVILLILSRQFLAAGIYFDRVYMRPDSASRFPARSYPLDFITRLTEMLVAVAASTASGLDSRGPAGLSPFLILTFVMLVLESLWLLLARAAAYSTAGEIAPVARTNFGAFLVFAILHGGLAAAGWSAGQTEVAVLSAIALFTGSRLAGQIRSYEPS